MRDEGGERSAAEGETGGDRYHRPVLVDEVLAFLEPEGGGLFVDGTVGGGGHAEALLRASPDLRLVGIDRDPEALEAAGRRLAPYGERARLVRGNFARAGRLAGLEPGTVRGALLDLGVSSRQIDAPERGFTFEVGAPLDMRMGGAGAGRTAADVLNEAPVEELARILREYGDERRAWAVARAVDRRRKREPLATSDDLVAALATGLGRRPRPRDKARVFQALRIEVNGELDALEEGLPALRDLLESGGVLAVIAYHSLEDRLVKRAFRKWSRACVCPPEIPVCRCRGRPLGETLTSSPVRAGDEEVRANPRARSARLRAWTSA